MFIVTDIGGTNMRVASVKDDTLGDIQKVRTPKDQREGVATFATLARECAGGEKITAIAGCVAGSVSETGEISDARNLRAWEGMNIVQEFSKVLDASVQIVNDAALVGLGEAHYGAGKGASVLAYVTVSTGVGGGLIRDGKIADASGNVGIQINGVDLEDLVSGTAVTKKFGIPSKDLDSIEERNKLADILAEGLRILVDRWSPDTIVLGGSMIVGVNPIPMERIQESLSKLLGAHPNPPTVKMAELADSGGLWGAVALLKQQT